VYSLVTTRLRVLRRLLLAEGAEELAEDAAQGGVAERLGVQLEGPALGGVAVQGDLGPEGVEPPRLCRQTAITIAPDTGARYLMALRH